MDQFLSTFTSEVFSYVSNIIQIEECLTTGLCYTEQTALVGAYKALSNQEKKPAEINVCSIVKILLT